ncbi:MAG: hypothetical protein A4E68_01010 [Syntrophaceae bacterium PtaB.Bin095]|jgi:hypothetical protein|nr:MAG: hypothetical protein A4E68_01010 [Syntrophaceae bacterium PtaB.Bin095]
MAVSQWQKTKGDGMARSGDDRNASDASANSRGERLREGKTSAWKKPDGRWYYLLGVAERMSAIRSGGGWNPDRILDSIESNLIGLSEVFPRETDPVTDLEGYAVRRFSQEILRIIHRELMPRGERDRAGIATGSSGGMEVKAP